jgi:hypothetical protein
MMRQQCRCMIINSAAHTAPLRLSVGFDDNVIPDTDPAPQTRKKQSGKKGSAAATPRAKTGPTPKPQRDTLPRFGYRRVSVTR